MIAKLKKYYHTLKHVQLFRQIIYRLWAKAKLKYHFFPKTPSITAPAESLQPRFPFLFHDPWNHTENLKAGDICFLNLSHKIGFPFHWQIEAPLLWLFNLHYFDYLNLLAEDQKVQLCEDWIEKHPDAQGTAWHPYTTSKRITNWIKNSLPSTKIQKSLFEQTHFLYHNLEYYHPGNHYLENARALIFAGLYFKNTSHGKTWLAQGLSILDSELKDQILSDGGFFERSPMYHALMLELVLDVINVLPKEHTLWKRFHDSALSMADFLAGLTHPDGHIALFNDATQEIAPPTSALLSYSQSLTSKIAKAKLDYPASGYHRIQSQDLNMIVDLGAIGPDDLPAHAHSDIFSFELLLGQTPFFVDTGVFEYQAGKMRQYCRQTSAHNTVSVDQKDQIECWSSFRVARRFKPYDVHIQREGAKTILSAQYAGYSKLIGDKIVHKRIFEHDAKNGCLVIHDDISGQGSHLIASHFHLSPFVEVEKKNDQVILKNDQKTLLLKFNSPHIEVNESWYCPRFGQKIPNKVLVHKEHKQLPCRFSVEMRY